MSTRMAGPRAPPSSFKLTTSKPVTSKITATYTHRPRMSSFSPIPNTHRLKLFIVPQILRNVLQYLSWADFRAFVQCCRNTRSLFDSKNLRDVVLARFVKQYAWCLSVREEATFQDVPLSLQDLDMFLISELEPLHRYPMHALKSVSSLLPSLDPSHGRTTERLTKLCLAHSKMVLLLQSMVHSSSSLPVVSESFLEPQSTNGTNRRHKSRLSRPRLRELTFPQPLSMADSLLQPSSSLDAASFSSSLHARHMTLEDVPSSSSHPPSSFSLSKRSKSTPRSKQSSRKSGDHSMSPRRSFFDFGFRSDNPPLPAPSEPRELASHSKSWRRSLFNTWSTSASEDDLFSYTHRRLGSSSGSASSSSSLVNSPTSTRISSSTESVGPPTPPSSSGRHATTAPASYPNQLNPSSLSPHDLALAAVTSRAPVVRTFVPCTDPVIASDNAECVLLCEKQLIEGGIWDHLSTGDVVCNLGHIPGSVTGTGTPSPGSSPGDSRSDSFDDGTESSVDAQKQAYHRYSLSSMARNVTPSKEPRQSHHHQQQQQHSWLIFDGTKLVPFSTLASELVPPPLPDAASLPSPFYYLHIAPQPLPNPVFYLSRIPHSSGVGVGREPVMVQTSCRVASPHSPMGCALVKRYNWVLSVLVDGDESITGPGFGFTDTTLETQLNQSQSALTFEPVGKGWRGEWVIEGEGTPEGKRLLEDCVRRRWLERPIMVEVVLEKCTTGKTWLRILTPSAPRRVSLS